ncbi:DUF6265 family protein [Allosphingosinicella sp.]|jgi:hypothetical protein|uniref:DUF6265 family protein n=1 Tax=Allosphingosinicella sp. TaxID=2823234 RepID=UPI002F1FFDD8
MNTLLLAIALQAQAPDLDWLAGYWLSCEDGQDVADTWSERRGGIMLGTSITTGDDSFSWEQMRIEAGPDGALAFVAQLRGGAPTAFPLLRWSASEAVFENRAHDFPQRVIYRREGDRLTGRIEGVAGGRQQAMEWHYRSAPLNTRCDFTALG